MTRAAKGGTQLGGATDPPPDRRGIRSVARRLGDRVPSLARRSSLNGLAQMVPQLAALAFTPFLLHRLGQDRYAIWALAAQVVQVLLSLDGGLGASLSRFFAVHRATGDGAASTRLVVSATLVLLAIGALASAVLATLAPLLAFHVLDVADALRPEARMLFAEMGLILTVLLIGNIFTGLLAAHGRFGAILIANVAGTGAYVTGLRLFVRPTGDLSGLFYSVLLESSVVVVAGCLLSLPNLVPTRAVLLRRSELREVCAFAVRMQVTGLSVIVMSNTDAFVIAALLPARYVALYSVAASAAIGVRSIPLWSVPPASVEMALAYASGGTGDAVEVFRSLNVRWQAAMTGYTAIGAVSILVAVRVWLGSLYWTSAIVAVILMIGFGVNLGTAMMSALARAVGQPGVETRYAAVCTVINLVLTVPLGLAFGIYGVEAATAIGMAVGSLWFCRALRAAIPGFDLGALFRDLPLGRACSAAAAAGVVELGILWSGLRGLLGLAVLGIPAVAAFAGFALLMRRREPVPGANG